MATCVWSASLQILHIYQYPLTISVVCFLYYVIRCRFYPSPPHEGFMKPMTDNSMRVAQMKEKASRQEVFNEEELDVVVRSFQYAMGNFSERCLPFADFDPMDEDSEDEHVDWMCIRGLIKQTANKIHKDWAVTESSADLLTDLIGTPDSSPLCCKLLLRVLEEGGWRRAEVHAENRLVVLNTMLNPSDHLSTATSSSSTLRQRGVPTMSADATPILTGRHIVDHQPLSAKCRPWAVVVCGLNGIRKTTSLYQPWFQELLHSAIGLWDSGNYEEFAVTDLPCGNNSFFRQLDYLMATIACEDFRGLYEKAGLIDVAEYSEIKAAIFARYRTLAEMIGIMLLKEARLKGMNVMLETSGKDVSSFRCIDHLFPNSNTASSWESREYNKLIVHFVVDNITCAEQSVDERMQREMREGVAAVQGDHRLTEEVIRNIISVNSGGPYGSEVLQQVQVESDAVMNKVFAVDCNSEGEGANGEEDNEFIDWFKARITIKADAGGWYACSVTTAGEIRKKFPFGNRAPTGNHHCCDAIVYQCDRSLHTAIIRI